MSDAGSKPSGSRSGERGSPACPHCLRVPRLKPEAIKPGRFRLRCGGCQKMFHVVVASDGSLSADKSAAGADDDEQLSPSIAAALGLDTATPTQLRPPPKRAPRRGGAPGRGDGEDGATLPPGGADATAAPPAARSADSASVMGSGVTLAPGEPRPASGPGMASVSGDSPTSFDTPPSHSGPTLPPPAQAAGERLGGYQLLRKLGEGGMGAVYLARQISLERDVALKVLSPRLSASPSLVSRFLREAYAAGQLVHHNVVQIYDFGKERARSARAGSGGAGVKDRPTEVHYFSMEFVDGASLQKLVQDKGRLEPKEAVGLILQAARGLAFAHEHGLIHRDVKPDNLMVNRLGVVKVADLGLVKQLSPRDLAEQPSAAPEQGRDASATDSGGESRVSGREAAAPSATSDDGHGSISAAASAQVTHLGAMMGTPAYMPPEQAADAKHTDARADIYSLGCTLYHLLVGRPPFGGRTLQEVLDGHRSKPLVFPVPEEGGPRLSSRLVKIVGRMCEKSPDHRYGSMSDVVEALERYLQDRHRTATTEVDEQQQKVLVFTAQQFNQSSWAKLRPIVVVGFVVALILGIGISAMALPNPVVAFGLSGGLIGFGVLTFAVGFVLSGMRRRDALFSRAREVVLGAGLIDWLIALAGLGVLGAVLFAFGWLWWWLGAAAAAVIAAWIYEAVVSRGVATDQNPMVARAERAIKELREAGVDENHIRRVVAEAAGRHWEGFYESLFGYEAKLDARRTFGLDEKGREKPQYAAWRDPLVRWLQQRLDGMRFKREQSFLRSLHEHELTAAGIKADIARKQAEHSARREVAKAHMLREQIRAEVRRELHREMLRSRAPGEAKDRDVDAEEETADDRDRKLKRKAVKYTDDDFERIHESYFKRRFGTPLDLLLGQQVRFVIAAALLACFAMWFNQHQEKLLIGRDLDEEAALVEQERLAERIERRSGTGDAPPITTMLSGVSYVGRDVPPVNLGMDESRTIWVSGLEVGIAGGLLALSALFWGRLLAAGVLLASAVAIVGPKLVEPRLAWIPLVAAALLWLLAVFFLRESDE